MISFQSCQNGYLSTWCKKCVSLSALEVEWLCLNLTWYVDFILVDILSILVFLIQLQVRKVAIYPYIYMLPFLLSLRFLSHKSICFWFNLIYFFIRFIFLWLHCIWLCKVYHWRTRKSSLQKVLTEMQIYRSRMLFCTRPYNTKWECNLTVKHL